VSPSRPRREAAYRGPRRRVVQHDADGDMVAAVTLECGHRVVYRRLQRKHEITNCPECRRDGDPRERLPGSGAARDEALATLRDALERSERQGRDLRAALDLSRGTRPPTELSPLRREQVRVLAGVLEELRRTRDWGPLVGALRRKYRATTAPERMAAEEDLERAVRAAGILDG
jgi:hypothetical protein